MKESYLKDAINRNLSTYDIAQECQLSQTAVRYWLRKFGLNTKHNPKAKYLLKLENGCYCINCGNNLKGYQVKFCSPSCRTCFHNKNNSKPNANTNERQKKVSKERKLELIKIKGGRCQQCGYNKNYAALCFHHKNPHEKTFQLDGRKLSNTSWASILLEVEKCDLLCSNCHSEIHHPNSIINESTWTELEESKKQKELKQAVSKPKKDPKPRKTKINWPSKEELFEMIWSMPCSTVSKNLGVSDKAIEKRCKKYEILKPPRGYWAKLNSKTVDN